MYAWQRYDTIPGILDEHSSNSASLDVKGSFAKERENKQRYDDDLSPLNYFEKTLQDRRDIFEDGVMLGHLFFQFADQMTGFILEGYGWR